MNVRSTNIGLKLSLGLALASAAPSAVSSSAARAAEAPVDYLKASFRLERILDWGERPDWSRDGKKLAFTKSDIEAGPAYEIDIATKRVRCLTCRWGANGDVTRIYYLPSGNFLIEGPPSLGTAQRSSDTKPHRDPRTTELYWMAASLALPPQRLDAPAWGEIAIAAKPTADGGAIIGWGAQQGANSRILTAELVETGDKAVLIDRRVVYSHDASKTVPGSATFAETYGFRRDGSSIMFWTVEAPTLNGEMYELNLKTGALKNLSNNSVHDETHFFPDERFGLEESNRASDPDGSLRGVSGLEEGGVRAIAAVFGARKDLGDLSKYAPLGPLKGLARPFDLYVRTMDGSPGLRRLTDISHLGGNAHQSVVAPDGLRIAFAMIAPASGPFTGKGGLYIGTFEDKR